MWHGLPYMPSPTIFIADPVSGTNYAVYIAGDPGLKPVCAVFFLDGDDQFAAAMEAYCSGRNAGRLPCLLLVGVGYGASYTKPGNFRIRDYTPTSVATEQGSGGANAFLSFLTGTLWTELAGRFRLREDQRGLAGHSLGSLLVVHAMLQGNANEGPFFNRLLASSPSLWWDDRSVLRAAERLQGSGSAIPAHLFLSVGEDDTESMTTDLRLFEQQLAAAPFPQLKVTSRRFPGRDHYNVLEDAFGAGLEALFA